MTSRLAKNQERDRAQFEFERAHPPAADLVCLMCVRTAAPGRARCDVCGGTLLPDLSMSLAFNT